VHPINNNGFIIERTTAIKNPKMRIIVIIIQGIYIKYLHFGLSQKVVKTVPITTNTANPTETAKKTRTPILT
jgi:hypothetical protein